VAGGAENQVFHGVPFTEMVIERELNLIAVTNNRGVEISGNGCESLTKAAFIVNAIFPFAGQVSRCPTPSLTTLVEVDIY
ncbi:MAG: hypothetical protein H6Q04_1881, partial [Acidobacteria bacterium]|nr:hypothetical protein [Acidobacteriota bacterium]